ncbi:hypothetical protein [Limnochorda pilosa]|uniref:Uncharacterized protein n=1 Tax=Limnochorda pilosa TaxID=1555112 RepID=A0A0K2SPY2_LIMPI|nr:hypothetical protein [Limnochorda pilosa]BAS29146.1 hypothetical protein LIP_3333 [Limnochorda pilosa]
MDRGCRYRASPYRGKPWRRLFLAAAVLLLAAGPWAASAAGTEEPGKVVLSQDQALDLLDTLIARRPLDQGRVRFRVEGTVAMAGLDAPFLAEVEQRGAKAVVNVEEAPPFVPREIEAVLSDARTFLADFDFSFAGVELLEEEPQAVFQGTLRKGASGARKGSVWISLETGELRRLTLSYWWGTVDSTLEYGLELGHQVVQNQQVRVSPWGLSLTLRYHGFRWLDGEDQAQR